MKRTFKSYSEAVYWLLMNSEYYADLAREEAERLVEEGEFVIEEEQANEHTTLTPTPEAH